ncbi:hypothetical protein [Nocardia sp. NBC_01327]|uniref:hypothetical protein n=1 Tax=Nocardia sp. NBC_01327 TaxID=2903593 RepID=UPI002E121A77|nr:hypothetical protein OG326_20930 [Nocardia sp. NBC_01327]
MTMLTYTVLTDPASLEASKAGQSSSFGTVYLMVTNTGSAAAYWLENVVKVPVGNGADHLTPDISLVTATGEFHSLNSGVRTLNVQTQVAAGSFKAADPSSGKIQFAPGDYLVLTLEDVPVAETTGLAVLRVQESASRGPNAKASSSVATVALVKTAAKSLAPSNFRPDQALLEDGDSLVLRWDGPDDLAYTIGLPDGTLASVTAAGEWRPDPKTGPIRDATYTLIATDPATARQHFLTTTVQLREPTFENGIHASRVRGPAGTGRLEFNATGVQVTNEVGAYGEVLAYKVVSNLVKAQRVEGMPSGIGGIEFTAFGIQVSNTSGGQSVVITDRVAADLVNATRVQGPGAFDGSITFPKSGIQVCNGNFDNTPHYGYVFAEAGIYQNQSFSAGTENRWIDLTDGGEVSVKHRRADGTTTYGSLRVSRVDTDAARW